MSTMPAKYLPSINILRDSETEINYRLTSNSERVLRELDSSYSFGFRSFVIIGSYGTGKSAFLLTLTKHLKGTGLNFSKLLPKVVSGKYEYIEIVGSFQSIQSAFRESIGLTASDDVLKELSRLHDNSKDGLIIVIDEFGKFLEYASNTNPKEELYFIQQLAELVNDPKKKFLLICSLHQSFESYGFEIKSLKNEWEKVKGRFKEITFNEPVEQLLHIAADFLDKPVNATPLNFINHTRLIVESRILDIDEKVSLALARKLLPLDILSAVLLTLALQKYGQNERSLFKFLLTTDFNDIEIEPKSDYYHLGTLYDYLISHYFSTLTTKANPDYIKWALLRGTLDRVDSMFDEDVESIYFCIKTIGLLNILLPSSKAISKKFLTNYIDNTLGIQNAEHLLTILEKKKLIKYVHFKSRYVLFEGTDLDLEVALSEADNLVGEVNFFDTISEFFKEQIIPARANYIRMGTPRFIKFVLTDQLYEQIPKGDLDGYIFLVFNDRIGVEETLNFSKQNPNLNIYLIIKDSKLLLETVRDLEKIRILITKFNEDRVAVRELIEYREHLVRNLNNAVTSIWSNKESESRIIFKGVKFSIKNRTEFNRFLDFCLVTVYKNTPRISNELINREKLPGAITLARKSLFDALLNNYKLENLGYSENTFPPDKTIYLSLLKSTGIHNPASGTSCFQRPTDTGFASLWDECESFLDSTIYGKKSLQDLFNLLSSSPWKIKKGFLDFWIPTFLFIKRDEIAVFHSDVFVAQLSSDIIDILIKVPKEIFIKKLDTDSSKLELFNIYKKVLKKEESLEFSSSSLLELIKPFVFLYKNLSYFAKHTGKLSSKALETREVLAKAVDPEKLLFEDLPNIFLEQTVIQEFSDQSLVLFETEVKSTVQELMNCQFELYVKFEALILDSFGLKGLEFLEYKTKLSNLIKLLDPDVLMPKQTSLFYRLTSEIQDRNAWLNSICSGVVGKNLDNLSDQEVTVLFLEAKKLFDDLKTFLDFTQIAKGSGVDNLIKITLQQIGEPQQNKVVALQKSLSNEDEDIKVKLVYLLNGIKDKNIRQQILIEALREGLSDE